MRILASLVFLAGCLPDGGPPEGSVRGMLAGVSMDYTIDSSSELILQAKTTCATTDINRFSLNYGVAAFHIEFDVAGVNVLADMELVAPPLDNSSLSWFRADEPVAMVSATLTVGIDSVLGRRSGDFRVVYVDGSVIDGDFDLIYDARGDRPSCGGGGGGGFDD